MYTGAAHNTNYAYGYKQAGRDLRAQGQEVESYFPDSDGCLHAAAVMRADKASVSRGRSGWLGNEEPDRREDAVFPVTFVRQ